MRFKPNTLILAALTVAWAANAGAEPPQKTNLAAPENCAWWATNPNFTPDHFLICPDKSGASFVVGRLTAPGPWRGVFDEHTFEAAQQGDALAMVSAGDFYQGGPPFRHNSAKAIGWYRKAAAAGNARGMLSLAYLYMRGDGIAKDPAEARKWLDAAIVAVQAQVDTGAMLGIGFLYEDQALGLNDQGAGAHWFKMAADMGDAQSMFQMANREPAERQKWIDAYGAASDANLVTFAADDYASGRLVPRDLLRAAGLYKRSFELGYPRAALYLGEMYEKGEGVFHSDKEAARWYRSAADKGEPDAMERLAGCYREGRGVKKSFDEANRWQAAAEARRKELPGPVTVLMPVEPPKKLGSR